MKPVNRPVPCEPGRFCKLPKNTLCLHKRRSSVRRYDWKSVSMCPFKATGRVREGKIVPFAFWVVAAHSRGGPPAHRARRPCGEPLLRPVHERTASRRLLLYSCTSARVHRRGLLLRPAGCLQASGRLTAVATLVLLQTGTIGVETTATGEQVGAGGGCRCGRAGGRICALLVDDYGWTTAGCYSALRVALFHLHGYMAPENMAMVSY